MSDYACVFLSFTLLFSVSQLCQDVKIVNASNCNFEANYFYFVGIFSTFKKFIRFIQRFSLYVIANFVGIENEAFFNVKTLLFAKNVKRSCFFLKTQRSIINKQLDLTNSVFARQTELNEKSFFAYPVNAKSFTFSSSFENFQTVFRTRVKMDLSCNQSPLNDQDFTEEKQQQSKKEEILRRNNQILIHSSQCRDANCRQMNCRKMKNVVEHTKHCKKRTSEQKCSLCKSAFSLYCHHGMNCSTTDESCSVAICSKVKQKMIAQRKSNRSSLSSNEDETTIQCNTPIFNSNNIISDRPFIGDNRSFNFIPVGNNSGQNLNNDNVMLSSVVRDSSSIKNSDTDKLKSQQDLSADRNEQVVTPPALADCHYQPTATLNQQTVTFNQETVTLNVTLNQPIANTASYRQPAAILSRDLIQTDRLLQTDHFNQSSRDDRVPIVGVSTKDGLVELQNRTAAPNVFDQISNNADNVRSSFSFDSSQIFLNNNNNMYNVPQQNFYNDSVMDFGEIFSNTNQNNFSYGFPLVLPPVAAVPYSASNNPARSSSSSVIVRVPPRNETETKIKLPVLEIDENEDFGRSFCVQDIYDFGSSSSSSSGNNNSTGDASNLIATLDDDDDDGIEIIAEIKNVEVVAQLPKTDSKGALKRRRYSKETKGKRSHLSNNPFVKFANILLLNCDKIFVFKNAYYFFFYHFAAVVEAAEEDLTCCICLEPFDTPVLCLDCKKITGCKKCIDGWGAHCPSCRGTTGTTIVRGLDKLSAKLREYEGDA